MVLSKLKTKFIKFTQAVEYIDQSKSKNTQHKQSEQITVSGSWSGTVVPDLIIFSFVLPFIFLEIKSVSNIEHVIRYNIILMSVFNYSLWGLYRLYGKNIFLSGCFKKQNSVCITVGLCFNLSLYFVSYKDKIK